MSKAPEEIKALCQEAKAIMARKFPGHDHGEDVDLGVIWDALDNAESYAQSTQQGGEGENGKVVIKNINEPISYLYYNETLVGEISTGLQLNDCLLQIFRNKLDGYSLLYEGINYTIENNGRIKNAGNIYNTYSKQMSEIIGF